MTRRVVDSLRRAVPHRAIFTFLGALADERPRQPRRRAPSRRSRPTPRGSTPLQFDKGLPQNARPEGGGRRRRSRRNRQRYGEGGAAAANADVFAQPEFPQPVGPPLLSAEQLDAMSKAELNELAKTFDIENPTKSKKDELIAQIADLQAQRSGLEKANGVLDILPEGYGFLRREGYLVGTDDIYISQSQIRRFELRRGDLIAGQVRRPKENEKYYGIVKVETINGEPPEAAAGRRVFETLGALPPVERFSLETRGDLLTRAIDLFAPLGKGQRTLLVAPPRTQPGAVLARVAAALTANVPETQVINLTVDERPEHVAHLLGTLPGEIVATSFEEHPENHVLAAELVFERAKRLVEQGRDVVVLIDSLTRLVRAYGANQPQRAFDHATLARAKRLFGAARAVEGGGSLTIVAVASAGTGSYDLAVLDEFAPAANAEWVFSRELAEGRAYPPLDLVRSTNVYDDALVSEIASRKLGELRRALAGVPPLEASERAYTALARSATNDAFLGSADLAKV